MAKLSDWKPDTFDINIGDMMLSVIDSNEHIEDSRCEMHFHSVYELQYVQSGSMPIRTAGNSYTVGEGEYIIIPPNCLHSTENSDAEKYAFLFSLNFLPKANSQTAEYRYYNGILGGMDGIVIRKNNTVTDCINRIIGIRWSGNSAHKLKILFGMLLLAVAEDASGAENAVINENVCDVNETLYKQRLRGVVGDYISRFCNESDILASVAEILHMSERNTARIIKDIFGVSLSALVLNQRMVYAKELIRDSELSFGEIAEKVGYRQYNTFYKAFKKHYGISPENMRV